MDIQIGRDASRAIQAYFVEKLRSGADLTPKEPLRPVFLTQKSVSPLFGTRAPQVAAWAASQHLSSTDLGQVLRMVEYYNQISFKQP